MANLSNINNKLLVGTNGEVRIGDTATIADVKLRVKQTAQQWTAQFVNTDSSVAYGISIDTSASSYGVAGTLQCYTNSGGGFIVRNDSRVGIGTASPGSKLTVNEAGTATAALNIVTARYGISLQGAGTSNTQYLLNLQSNGGSTDVMRVQSSGNVGIGTTSPGAPLEIAAESTNVGNTLLNIGNAILNPNTRDSWIKMFGSQATVDKTFAVGNLYGKFVVNYLGTRATNPESGGTKMFTIDGSNGNVGIGTTSPDCKLTVAGSGSGGVNPSTISSNTVATFRRTGGVSHNANISILAGTSGASILNFGDRDNEDAGIITYTHDSGGSDTMAFTVGTSEKMRIINSGNVGIGTTSPSAKLDIGGNTAGSVQATFGRGNSDNNFAIRYINGDAGTNNTIQGAIGLDYANGTWKDMASVKFIRDSTAGELAFYTSSSASNGTEKMRITSGGSVGIGTSSPTGLLEIESTTNPVLRISNGGGTSPNPKIELYRQGGVLGNIQYSAANKVMILENQSALGGFAFDIAGSSKMVMDLNGNVGIGTTSPGARLEVYGTDGSRTHFNEGLRVTRETVPTQYGMVNYNGGALNIISVNTAGTGSVTKFMRSGNGTSLDTSMVIDTSGNVGIGATGPLTKMQINGCLGIGSAIYDGNISRSFTNFSQQPGGSLHINIGLGGGASSGDTVTFEYAALSWKSWSLVYNFASTSGISYGVCGGYWNGSGGSTNQTQQNNLGVSVAVTHNGQSNLITFTFTNLGTHAMANFVYMQSGGDGQPIGSRVTITANS